jgi:hypothetical protein
MESEGGGDAVSDLLTSRLLQKFKKFVRLDLSEKMVEFAKKEKSKG